VIAHSPTVIAIAPFFHQNAAKGVRIQKGASAMASNKRGIILLPGEGVSLAIPGLAATFKVVTRDTDGDHSVIETTIPAGSPGPPPHRHRAMDEEFYILDGELTVRVGEQTFTAARGAFAYVPRGIVHAFANRGDRPVTFLDIVHPAGFEQYYRELAAAYAAAGGTPSRETFTALLAKYDTEVMQEPGA
jgi:quercetin dioxygenase-like cupin family protein